MKHILGSARFIIILGVVGLFLAALATFIWGVFETVVTIVRLITTFGADPHVLVSLIEILDIFLIGMALLTFSVSLYELFIGELALPAWLVVKDIDELKAKVISIVVLVLGVTFLEHVIAWTNAQDTFLFGLAIAAVSLVLIFLYRTTQSD